jgi:hypothetical protein
VTLNELVVAHYRVVQLQVLSDLEFEPAYKAGVLITRARISMT